MLVSIIAPFFNEERTRARILERTVEATLPAGMNREHVLVDDGSADGSAEIAAAFVRERCETAGLIRLSGNQGKGAEGRRRPV